MINIEQTTRVAPQVRCERIRIYNHNRNMRSRLLITFSPILIFNDIENTAQP